jgi:hypothetical protein
MLLSLAGLKGDLGDWTRRDADNRRRNNVSICRAKPVVWIGYYSSKMSNHREAGAASFVQVQYLVTATVRERVKGAAPGRLLANFILVSGVAVRFNSFRQSLPRSFTKNHQQNYVGLQYYERANNLQPSNLTTGTVAH